MTFQSRIASGEDRELWNSIVESSPHGTPFHTWDWLKIVHAHTGTSFYPLILSKGTTDVALYPLFVKRFGIFNIAYSPPPNAYMSYLGPIIRDYEGKKQDRKETLFYNIQTFVDNILFRDLKCKYSRIRLSPGFYDSRPLRWCGYAIEPMYTYRIDLTPGSEAIWKRFDLKLKAGINRALKKGVTIREGGREDLQMIQRELIRRMGEQGIRIKDRSGYLMSLYEGHKDQMKIFLAYHEGRMVGNVVALLYKNSIRLWMGTLKSEVKGTYANDLIQWEIIRWACNNGYRVFENIDLGDSRRLTAYKARFNPEPLIWFSAEKYISQKYNLYKFLKKWYS